VRQARAWKAEGLRDAEIARRLGVSHKTAAKVVAEVESTAAVQAVLDLGGSGSGSGPAQTGPGPESALPDAGTPGGEGIDAAGRSGPSGPPVVDQPGTARIGVGRFTSRYAGAMLLHAFTDRAGAADVFAQATGVGSRPGLRFDDLAVLTATSIAFGLGFASLEQAKHPDRAQVGPVAGITVLPELRTLRPRLAGIAENCDPLALQRSFATAMLAAEPCVSGLYFVDEHFMPYTGALPVGKGWNTKRRHAEPGRIDTHIADATGRAVCFTSGEPSGLSISLGPTLDELRMIVGPDAPILLAFDRGGAYPVVFRACRTANVHWATYRRGKLTTPTRLPIRTTVHRNGREIVLTYAEELIDIKDYGQARQITVFDNATTKPVLQILTSDTTTCPTTLILFLRARWRIENLFKYLDFYGIDYLADYHATLSADTHKIDNPQRVELRKQLTALTAGRDQLRERIGALHTDQSITIATLNRESTTAQRRIRALDKKITKLAATLKNVPAKLPANLINPHAQRAVHRTRRRGLQMVLRLLAANAEHWLAHHLNTYLQDDDEYRATTRNLLHLGGTITYTEAAIHIELDQPNTPRLTDALTLLLDEINQNPPHIPGDPRPLTYTLKP
jgi:hypothetical protein